MTGIHYYWKSNGNSHWEYSHTETLFSASSIPTHPGTAEEPIFLEYFWDENTSTGSRNSYMTSMLVVVIMATSLHQENGCKTTCWVKTFPRRLTALFYVLNVMFSWYFEKTQRFYTLILIHEDIQVWIFVILVYFDTRDESIMAADDWSMSGTMPSTSKYRNIPEIVLSLCYLEYTHGLSQDDLLWE